MIRLSGIIQRERTSASRAITEAIWASGNGR
jgi:hypothetical protein